MKKFIRNALFGAAGLVALSLPAHAVGSATVADAPLVKSNTAQQQLAQRPYDPSAGGVGFKKSKKKKAEQQQINWALQSQCRQCRIQEDEEVIGEGVRLIRRTLLLREG